MPKRQTRVPEAAVELYENVAMVLRRMTVYVDDRLRSQVPLTSHEEAFTRQVSSPYGLYV